VYILRKSLSKTVLIDTCLVEEAGPEILYCAKSVSRVKLKEAGPGILPCAKSVSRVKLKKRVR